jgi:hypothetical protein
MTDGCSSSFITVLRNSLSSSIRGLRESAAFSSLSNSVA